MALEVEGVLGEFSPFHEMYSYYAQGVSLSTAKLPAGWQERLVPYDMRSAHPARAMCLDPHDLVISKLVAMREKDREFAMALLDAGLIQIDVLRERVTDVPDAHPVARRAAQDWIEGELPDCGIAADPPSLGTCARGPMRRDKEKECAEEEEGLFKRWRSDCSNSMVEQGGCMSSRAWSACLAQPATAGSRSATTSTSVVARTWPEGGPRARPSSRTMWLARP